MPFFSAGQHAYGIIAVGQFARGIIAIGQISIGVVAIGQLGLGIFTFNQAGAGLICLSLNAGIGLFTVALAGIGIVFAYGMAVIGFIANSKISFYEISYNVEGSEAQTLVEALQHIGHQISSEPVPFTLWMGCWTLLIFWSGVKFMDKGKRFLLKR